MKLEISMTIDKQLFEINHWWATAPEFVLDTLRAQLDAARILWPEALKNVVIMDLSNDR